jgi:predicted TIM-barrel fold metal-dependent hydrolase
MDEAGIDLQVLSHSIPGLQAVGAEAGPPLAHRTNDRLHEAVQRHPDRFSAFAVVPTANPRAAADELERAVTKLGFKGAMVNGMTGGVSHDDKRFWPIWERAAELDVPIYIHPALPHPAVIEAYYKDYAQSHPGILRAAWGFTVETATQGLRLVLSGVFDAHPGLKIILGHMGEGLPFLLWRISHGPRATMKEKTFGVGTARMGAAIPGVDGAIPIRTRKRRTGLGPTASPLLADTGSQLINRLLWGMKTRSGGWA